MYNLWSYIFFIMAATFTTQTLYANQKSETLANFELFIIFYPEYQLTLKNNLFEHKILLHTPLFLDFKSTYSLKLSWHVVYTPFEVTRWQGTACSVLHETFFFNWNNCSLEFLSNGTFCSSRTNVYPGRAWPERELSERHALLISGLKDTRRLLSDYATCDSPQDVEYNHLIQEII